MARPMPRVAPVMRAAWFRRRWGGAGAGRNGGVDFFCGMDCASVYWLAFLN